VYQGWVQAIYHFLMPSQYWLTSTFLRFQEFYESPRFREQTFTLEEFQDWYVTTRNQEFSYYTDWSGFNFPSYVVKEFTPRQAAWRFMPLSRKEKWVISQLPKAEEERFYVIGTYQGSRGLVISHEVVHGLFYLHPAYAEEVTQVLQEHDLPEFKKELLGTGYCEEVLIDEINAYLTTGLCTALRGKDWKAARSARPRLLRVFRKHFGFDVSKKAQAEVFIRESIHHIDGASVRPESA
jgi:hypothetical protein